MNVFVYRSAKQAEMYLYLGVRDQFDVVPEDLLKRFGTPEFALEVDLATRSKLAREDIAKVQAAISSRGYFLQLPPQVTGHLNMGG